jgi:uncharacterized protein (TIGR03435 family)
MENNAGKRSSSHRIMRKAAAVAFMMLAATVAPVLAQCALGQKVPSKPTSTSDWQAAVGGKMSFDVASAKPNKSADEPTSNFPLGPGDIYAVTGGRFCATSTTVLNYITFAHKLNGQQRQRIASALPGWVSSDRFDIGARGQANATKDQVRLMMQSLLADRFKLVLHHETQQSPALALVVAQGGKLGPQIQVHSDGSECMPAAPDSSQASVSGQPSAPSSTSGLQLPAIPCGGVTQLTASAPGRIRIGAKNIPIALLAQPFTRPQTGIDRPVFDRTGLSLANSSKSCGNGSLIKSAAMPLPPV